MILEIHVVRHGRGSVQWGGAAQLDLPHIRRLAVLPQVSTPFTHLAIFSPYLSTHKLYCIRELNTMYLPIRQSIAARHWRRPAKARCRYRPAMARCCNSRSVRTWGVAERKCNKKSAH